MTARRTAFLALALLAASAGAQRDPRGHYAASVAAGEPLCTLAIHITGFRDNTGAAGGLVFASPKGWPEDIADSIVHGGVPIDGRQAQLTFQVPPGRYAVVVLDDENSNMKLDRNFLGIPIEGFGFSNNPRVYFSAPSFRTAAVPVTCPTTELRIQLIYK